MTVGALACEAVYAQAMDLVFQVKPVVTVRPRQTKYEKASNALQKYIDWGVNGPFNFRNAFKDSVLDMIQLGTGIFYIPWMTSVAKTDLFKVTDRGPMIKSVKPEDFIMPPSAEDVQTAKFCSMRMSLSKQDLGLRARMQAWDTSDAATAGKNAPVMLNRFKLAGVHAQEIGDSTGEASSTNYDVLHTWARFDIDDDGVEEDLEVVWDYTSGSLFKVMYQQYDVRPFVLKPYQDRAHVPWGLGIPEMIAPFENEITEIHNQRVANMILVNTRMFLTKSDVAARIKYLQLGKPIEVDDINNDLKPLPMIDVYPSSYQSEAMTMAFAERRVGVNELSAPARLGGRTPGMTAMSMQQQMNRRFFPPFDNVRNLSGEGVMQCLYRLQEQLKDEKISREVEDDLIELLGVEEAIELFSFLRSKPSHNLVDSIDIELTASSVSVNREADKQNAMMLAQITKQYVEGVLQLEQMKNSTQLDPNTRQVAAKAVEVVNRTAEKIFKTFDQVTDVKQFLISEDGEDMPPRGLNGLAAQAAQFQQQVPEPAPAQQPAEPGPQPPPPNQPAPTPWPPVSK